MSKPEIRERKTTKGIVHARAASVESVNEETREVELSFSSEIPVHTWSWEAGEIMEILDHDPKSVRLDWLSSGNAPLLMDHNFRDQVGVITKAEIGGDRRGAAVVRFGKGARAEEVFNDVKDGIRKNVSVQFRVYTMVLEKEDKDSLPEYRVTDWEPIEVSIVSVPADTGVGVGRGAPESDEGDPKFQTTIINEREKRMPPEDNNTKPEGDKPNGNGGTTAATARGDGIDEDKVRAKATEEAREAEVKRQREIRGVARSVIGKLPKAHELADEAVEKGLTVDQFRGDCLEKITEGGSDVAPLGEPEGHLGLSGRDIQRYSLLSALRATVSKDWSGAEFEKECSDAIADKLDIEARGFYLPHEMLVRGLSSAFWARNADRLPPHLMAIARDITTSTGDTAKGGFLVAEEHRADMFIEALRASSMVMSMGARMLSGLVGNVDIPKQVSGGTAYWIDEGGDTTESAAVFGNVAMSPKTVSARQDITRRLLKQSDPSVEMLIREDMLSVLGIALDAAAINGSGTGGEPTGILNTNGIGSITNGTNGGALDWGDCVDFETEVAVDNALMGSLGYLTNPNVRGSLKQTEKATNTARFIWENGEVNGYRAEATTNVPNNLSKGSASGTLSAMIFGNWGDLIIGEWGGIDIELDKTTLGDSGGLVIRAFHDADIAVRNAQSFSASEDILP